MFFDKILTKIFGTANERVIKKLVPVVSTINDLEPETQKLSDEQLRAKTVEFRARIATKSSKASPTLTQSAKLKKKCSKSSCLKPLPSSAKPAGAP